MGKNAPRQVGRPTYLGSFLRASKVPYLQTEKKASGGGLDIEVKRVFSLV